MHKVPGSIPEAATAVIEEEIKRILCLSIVIFKMLDKLLPVTGRRKEGWAFIDGRRSLTVLLSLIAR